MKIITALALIMVFGASAAIAAKNGEESPKTVDWYMAPENKAALDATIAKCRNNPGKLADTPTCENAEAARYKLRIMAPPTSLK